MIDGDAFEALLRRVIREEVRQALRELPANSGSKLTPEQRRAVDALGEVFGVGSFTAADLVRALALDVGERPAARAAVGALSNPNDAQRVGQALGAIAKRGGVGESWRLGRPTKDANVVLWTLEGAPKG
jgi:hypothetical protein